MEFLALNDQFFIPAKVMFQFRNSVDFILIILAIPQNFYRYLAIIILQSSNLLRYSSILSRCNSKIIIAKNLQKFLRIASIMRIKSRVSNFLNIALTEKKIDISMPKTPCYLDGKLTPRFGKG